MGVSQILMGVLLGLNLLMGAHLHGKEKTGNHNFWIVVISTVMYMSILITGGFFE